MKETKVFFDEDNRLNKGYSHENSRESDRRFFYKRFEKIFPPLDIIETLEHLNEGSTLRLIELAEKEQAHRHALETTRMLIEERKIKLQNVTQIIITIILGYFTLQLLSGANLWLAIAVISSLTLIIIAKSAKLIWNLLHKFSVFILSKLFSKTENNKNYQKEGYHSNNHKKDFRPRKRKPKNRE